MRKYALYPRFPWVWSIVGLKNCPSAESFFSDPCTRGDEVFVCSTLDGQVSHIHSAAIPLQPEAHLLRTHSIFRQRIGPQIVPLLTHPVASFAHHPCFPPAERLFRLSSCGLRQSGKEAIDSSSVLDKLYMSNLSSPCHTRMPGASDQCTQLLGKAFSVYPFASRRIIIKGFLGSTSSWYQLSLKNYRSNVLISFTLLIYLLIVYAWESA